MGNKQQLDVTATLADAQRERLSFIELRAYFCGELRRADLEARFGIKPAAATRDLLAYRTLAPRNLDYDTSLKAYVPSRRFKPVFGFDIGRVLSWLVQGFGDGLPNRARRPILGDAAETLSKPSLEILATITRAIHQVCPLSVTYWSISSGQSQKVIVPFAIVDNGFRWHVRAYDRQHARFADFVITRISDPRLLDESPDEHELPGADHQWNRMVDLELVVHPKLRHPDAVAADYGMQDGVLRKRLRAAVVGYALHRWRVDCSGDHCLDPTSHHLWLRNTATLYGVESALMAAGHSAEVSGP